MGWEAWAVLGTVALMAFALLRNLAGPDTVLVAGMTLLMTLGLFSDRLPTPGEAISHYGNQGLATIAVLFVVAEGLTQTGAMSMVAQLILGNPRTITSAQTRLMVPVAALSAFLNNTPIVAMFIPVVRDWCKKTGFSPAKLFIPLSYAAIMGGSCTLIGTATNLVVYGMLDDTMRQRMGIFTISAVGVPATLVGMGYLLLCSHKILPNRNAVGAEPEDARKYTVEMLVEPGSAIDGKSIEKAGLRHLPGLYLAEIERGGRMIKAVEPVEILRGGDRLIFVGVVESVRDLQKIRGLTPATDQVYKMTAPRPVRRLVEAVVSDTCPLVGKSIREGQFRTVYNAVVIAVYRNGEQLADQKIGQIVLKPGDTLLIEAGPHFERIQRNRRDFFLVSTVADSQPIRHDRAWIALAILTGIVGLASTQVMELLHAALLGAGFLIVTGCCAPEDARRSVNFRVILTIGAALAVGSAVESTGAAAVSGRLLITSLGDWFGPIGVLTGIYLLATLFNTVIGAAGAAALIFPIAKAAAEGLGIDFMPFTVSIMMAVSGSYASVAYQTNLMVFGAGGYRFTDYIRAGLPLNLLVGLVVLTLAPLIWPFQAAAGG